jgi:hypothetical protein
VEQAGVDKSSSAEIIPAPTGLRLKMGGRFAAVDAGAVARAEAALKSLSGQFSQWMQDELDKLEQARSRVRAEGWTESTSEALFFRAHDLKGLGSTYEFPIVTRLAASLCRLLEEGRRPTAPLFLIDAHIDAIKASVRDEIRDVEHPLGRALVAELEQRVAAQLAEAA